jgi:capsular exopolysaccharide synthesis family protein
MNIDAPTPLSPNGSYHDLVHHTANEHASGEVETHHRSIDDLIALLRRRASLILSVFALFVGSAGLYCIISPPLYAAQSTIEIRGHAPALSNLQSEALFGSDTRKIEYQKTTIAKIALEGVADQVLSTDGLDLELDEYWNSRRSLVGRAYASIFSSDSSSPSRIIAGDDTYYLHPPSIIRRYLSLVDITPVHETNLVSITATTASPELSQRVANAHALGFIAHLQQERRDAITNNVSLLQRQAHDLKSRVTAAEHALAQYATSNKLLTTKQDEGTNINAKQIETLSTMLGDAVGRRIKSESLLQEAQSKRAEDSSVADNEVTQQLRVTMKQAETEYATQASKFMGPHPVMLELKAKVDSLKKALADERKRALKGIQSQFDTDKAAEERLRHQIEEERAAAQDVAQRLIHYNVLNKEASSLRELYQNVLRQVKEVEISAATATSNVFVADYASLPTHPSAPQTNVIVVLFGIIGLTAGILAAFIAESLEDTLATTEEVEGSLALPMLGAIPQFDPVGAPDPLPLLPSATNHEASEPALVAEEKPSAAQSRTQRLLTLSGSRDPLSEALRTLRASILLSSADRPPRIVMVSSAMQGEGKTTIVSHLAAILSQGAYRVVMVDADIRLSGLSKLFQVENSHTSVGLSELLTGQAPLEQVLQSTPLPGLDLIPAGNHAPDPAELLGSRALSTLLTSLRERYDFVLIDAPPVLPVADSLMLSQAVDSVVLVVRSQVTGRKHAQEARRRLLAVHARVLGVVLNDVDFSTNAREREMYGGYGGIS